VKDGAGARTIAVGRGGRLKKRASVEKATNVLERNDNILGGTPAMMKTNRTWTTVEFGDAGVAITTQWATKGVGRDNSGRKRRGPMARHQCITRGIIGSNAKIARGTRKVVTIVGNAKRRNLLSGRVESHIPKGGKVIGRSGHGASIHVAQTGSRQEKSRLGGTKMSIVFGAWHLESMETEV
jgi:hypothetical protein